MVGILTCISMMNTTSERPKARHFYICWYLSFYEQLKFRAHLSLARKKFHNLGARPRGYESFYTLNSTEHEISTAHINSRTFLAFKLPDVVLTILINVKMTTICGISICMNLTNFMLR